MKAVLISIQPQWVKKILRGEKTIEIRKKSPKLQPPFKCYIYCTQGREHLAYSDYCGFDMETYERDFVANRKVVAEFVCDRIFPIRVFNNGAIQYWNFYELEKSCVPYDRIATYIGTNQSGYGLHISELKIYDKPKGLCEFFKCGASTMEELDEQLCSYCAKTDYGEHKSCQTPTGYWACEGAYCDEAYGDYLDSEYALTRPPQSWCYVEELK